MLQQKTDKNFFKVITQVYNINTRYVITTYCYGISLWIPALGILLLIH